MAFSIISPLLQVLDDNANSLSGGKVYIYEPGTTTPKNSYPTSADADAATNANANPVVLNAAGRGQIWGVDGETYKTVVYSSADEVVATIDNIASPVDGVLGVIGNPIRILDSVAALIGEVGRFDGDIARTASFWSGWSVFKTGPVGSAEYVWDASRPKTDHNGGGIISPTVPWTGAESTFAAYIAGTGETDSSGTGCWVHVGLEKGGYNVLQWGAKNDATTNGANDAMIQPLLNFVESAVDAGTGGVINFPRGTYRFNTYFNVRDRTTLRGEGTTATVLQFMGTTVGDCITLGPVGPDHATETAGHHVFAVRLENMAISGGNAYKGADNAIVKTDGAHEHSGLFNVVIRDFVSTGVEYATGNGGPAHFEINSVEIYGSDTLPTTGSKRGIVVNASGAFVHLRHATISGGATNFLDQGVFCQKDIVIFSGVHFEQVDAGFSMNGNSRLTGAGITGGGSAGPLIHIASTFKGFIDVSGVDPNSVYGTREKAVNNARDASSEEQHYGRLTHYSYPPKCPRGSATLSAGTASVSFGSTKTITGITNADPAVVTSTAHGYETGDYIVIDSVAGMTEVNGGVYKIDVTDADHYELRGVDSSAFTTYASGGASMLEIDSQVGVTYTIALEPTAAETLYITAKTSHGFTVTSSNGASTATFRWAVTRRY